ncbi:MAG: alginate lyase family protein [Bacteroidota bacterium]
MVRLIATYALLIVVLGCPLRGTSQSHPRLLLGEEHITEIRAQLGQVPLFDSSLAKAKAEVDAAIAEGIQVPVPKDMAGGYTHEQHKKNFFMLQKAGAIFRITEEEKYAQYIRENLLAYAKLYPTLPIHPTDRSYATGKIFWQCLNDANWLVYVSQAYDCIYDWLPAAERQLIEKDLFRPFADFLSVENPQFYDRIHNHSTWGNAAVGMIGMVMGDEELIQRALYGLQENGHSGEKYDNDGGLIRLPGQKESGFLAQIDHAFSPDGYYTEGPYYQRYAIFPFMIFARSMANNLPEQGIFSYRDSLLIRSVSALLNQTNAVGEFFPINDAQKGMSYFSRELVTAVDISYYFGDQDPALLSVAADQGRVILDESGFAIAKDLAKGQALPFIRLSQELTDGAKGDEGALGIIRPKNTDEELCLLMKYTAQGLGHGHYDKLSFSYYDGGDEIMQDYGAARWVNIDQKAGGRYLKENKTWAKQSIAHNTLVVDEKSHFGGVFKVANANHSEPYLFVTDAKAYQLASAKEQNAYPGIEMHRTMIMLEDESLRRPLLIDIFRVTAAQNASQHQFDLPFYFQGQLMNSNFEYEISTTGPSVLGTSDGYQHLYQEAKGHSPQNTAWINCFNGEDFFTLYTAVDSTDELILARAGANDPLFNIRRDPALIVRKANQNQSVFLSALEMHGSYSPVTEIPLDPFGSLSGLEILWNDADYTVVRIQHQSGTTWTFCIANRNTDKEKEHSMIIDGKNLLWRGPTHLIKTPKDE